MKTKEDKGSKRLVLKFADGYGTYVGVGGWTFEYALRKAGHDLGIDPKAWQEGNRTQTRKTRTIQVIRKGGTPEPTAVGPDGAAYAPTGEKTALPCARRTADARIYPVWCAPRRAAAGSVRKHVRRGARHLRQL